MPKDQSDMKKPVPASPNRGSPLLARRLRAAANVLLLERIWRVGAALGTLALFFLALSWLGFWLEVGGIGRIIGALLFFQAGAYVCVREYLRGAPRPADALAQLDANAPAGLRPAASLNDSLAAGENPDPATLSLWSEHRQRLERALATTPLKAPDPRLPQRDPYALRALALVAAIAAAFLAGDDKSARLRAAFDWRLGGEATSTRLDVWLDPPAYTGRASLVLEAKDADSPAPIAVPVNSTLHVRSTSSEPLETSGALAPLPEPEHKPAARSGAAAPQLYEQTYKLTGSAKLILPDGRAFAFAALPDKPPTIALTDPPRANLRGTLSLAYRTGDDYGVTAAEAVVSRPGAPRALVPPPALPLSLPAGATGIGEARSTLDFSDSPYGGAKVALTLKAHDAADNEGASRPVEVTLPQRRFTKPLARALAEQRRELVLDPDGRMKVGVALEALSLAPDMFDTPAAIHLGLRAARRGLVGNRSDEQLIEVADLLWAMALSLEGGDAAQAERDLRAAEKNLRDAIAEGADEDEIAKRTQELRLALDKFLQQMAQQAARNRNGAEPQQQQGTRRALSEKDIQSMLDAIAKAAKAGDLALAQRLLDELQNVMENLQPSQGGGSAEGAKALSELDRLAREQQQLRDETFQRVKPGGDDEQSGMEDGGQGMPGARRNMAPRSGRQQSARPERGPRVVRRRKRSLIARRPASTGFARQVGAPPGDAERRWRRNLKRSWRSGQSHERGRGRTQ